MASTVAGKSTTVNREKLHREAMRILNADSVHFMAISLLFLPLTFSASVAVQSYFDPPTLLFIKTLIASYQTLISIKSLIIVVTFTIIVILPAVAGVALITYSANQAIHRKPLTFSSAVKSLSRSYIPLFSTIVAGSVTLILISLLFTLSAFTATVAIKPFNLDQFIVSICINTIASYAIVLTVLFFIVIWGSGAPIAVLESKLGFEPLRQSANRSTEFRWHSFSIVFIAVFTIGSAMMNNSFIVPIFASETNWVSVLKVCVICLHSSMMILHYAVANTVLHVQYKAQSGDEVVKTVAEMDVSGEYVKVAVNDEDEEVPDKQSKAVANGGFNYTCCFIVLFYFCLMVDMIWRILKL